MVRAAMSVGRSDARHFQSAADPRNLAIAEALDEMIIDHPDCLHVCIDDRRADETERALLEIAAERVGLGSRGGNLTHRSPSVLPWAAIDESPTIRIEGSKFFL